MRNRKAILAAVRRNPGIGAAGLAAALGMAKPNARRDTLKLVKLGELRSEPGPDGYAFYPAQAKSNTRRDYSLKPVEKAAAQPDRRTKEDAKHYRPIDGDAFFPAENGQEREIFVAEVLPQSPATVSRPAVNEAASKRPLPSLPQSRAVTVHRMPETPISGSRPARQRGNQGSLLAAVDELFRLDPDGALTAAMVARQAAQAEEARHLEGAGLGAGAARRDRG